MSDCFGQLFQTQLHPQTSNIRVHSLQNLSLHSATDSYTHTTYTKQELKANLFLIINTNCLLLESQQLWKAGSLIFKCRFPCKQVDLNTLTDQLCTVATLYLPALQELLTQVCPLGFSYLSAAGSSLISHSSHVVISSQAK